MSIVIEKALPSDAAMLLEYFRQIGGETDNLTFGAEGLPISVEAEASFISQMEHSQDNVMLVAKENGRIVGTASLNRLSRRMGHRGEFSVSVVKEYWNRGIGSLLLDEILAFARANSFKIIDLQVRSDNRSAIYMYEKYGFEKVGVHPAFFQIDNENVSFDYMYLKLM